MMVCVGWNKLADNDIIQIADINTLTQQFLTKLFNPKIKKRNRLEYKRLLQKISLMWRKWLSVSLNKPSPYVTWRISVLSMFPKIPPPCNS